MKRAGKELVILCGNEGGVSYCQHKTEEGEWEENVKVEGKIGKVEPPRFSSIDGWSSTGC